MKETNRFQLCNLHTFRAKVFWSWDKDEADCGNFTCLSYVNLDFCGLLVHETNMKYDTIELHIKYYVTRTLSQQHKWQKKKPVHCTLFYPQLFSKYTYSLKHQPKEAIFSHNNIIIDRYLFSYNISGHNIAPLAICMCLCGMTDHPQTGKEKLDSAIECSAFILPSGCNRNVRSTPN